MINKISGETCVTGVIGKDIHYTKSPFIHNYWYHHYKIDGVYVRFDAHEDNFETTIKGLFQAGIKGINVTVPFKEQAFACCDILSSEAELAKAVNCLTMKNGKLYGHNTDGIGFYNALNFLSPHLNLKAQSILVIGAGGAASAIIAYLNQYCHSISILNRTFDKAYRLAQSFNGVSAVKSYQDSGLYDIIIQTTSIKNIEPEGILDVPETLLKAAHSIIDINYGADAGEFLQQANKFNINHCDGLEMLLQQAVPAFNLFNQADVQIDNTLRKTIRC